MKDRADSNTGDLLTWTGNRFYDAEAPRHAESVFARLRLPLPQEGEFYPTQDRGALVPLSRYGCALRLTSVWVPPFVHTHVLQPLLRLDFDRFRAELMPGVRTPFITNDYTAWFPIFRDMEKDLEEHGVKVNDINSHNGGQLPPPCEDHFVFLDPGALQQIYDATREVKKLLPPALPADDPQERLFGGLKTAFNRAAANDNAGDMARAWDQCRRMKDAGLLIANWENVDYRGTSEIARRYERRLQQALG